MNLDPRHIIRTITITAAAVLAACLNSSAQTLEYPSRWKSPWEEPVALFTEDTVCIRFTGDVMMHSRQIETAADDNGGYDFSTYFANVAESLQEADLAVGNMEFSLAGRPYTGYPSFSAPDTYADYLAECGFDVFLTANNHVFDKGAAGAERTLDIYRDMRETHGIRFTGTAADEAEYASNNPLIILVNGIRIAFINFTYGSNLGIGRQWPKMNMMRDRDSIKAAMARAREQGADYTVVVPHWGTEYALRHSETQEDMARWLVGEGADAIIGAHPHVIQDYEIIEDVPVVYSMGNAVSNMSAANTQLELMVTMRIIRGNNGDLKMMPLEFTYLWCSLPGGYGSSYSVIPVKEFIDRKNEWQNPADYDKMVSTYRRVMKTTGVPEGMAEPIE